MDRMFLQKQEDDHVYEYEEHTLEPLFFHVGVFFRIKEVTTLSLVSSENKSFIDWSDRCWSLGNSPFMLAA